MSNDFLGFLNFDASVGTDPSRLDGPRLNRTMHGGAFPWSGWLRGRIEAGAARFSSIDAAAKPQTVIDGHDSTEQTKIAAFTGTRHAATISGGALSVPASDQLPLAAAAAHLGAAASQPVAGTYTILFNFAGTDGTGPLSSLTLINGVLYGTTAAGGSPPFGGFTTASGVLYSYAIATGQEQTRINFNGTNGVFGSNGSAPLSGVLDVNGTLYGDTSAGGSSNNGTLYSYSLATGRRQVLASFQPATGSTPASTLIDVNGTLYGTTLFGGTGDTNGFSGGTLFSYSLATGQMQTLVNFNGTTGEESYSGVTDVNGTLYGTTLAGGSSSLGTLYSYNIATGQFQTLLAFNGTNGEIPYADVTNVNGTLYGTTAGGGTSGAGVLYSYNIATGQSQTLFSFDNTDGSGPIARLTNVDGTLYGSTTGGGTGTDGVLFSYNIATGQEQTLVNFNGTNGYAPNGAVTYVNGALYGTAQLGGATGNGILFSYQINCFLTGTNILTESGETPVESLKIGDHVTLPDGTTAPIIWLGHRTIDVTRHPNPEAVLPILIEAGALADNVPHRDLLLSPDHALYLNSHLIPAKALINGVTIRQVARRSVTYHHVELATHAVLRAEGAPCESYLETGNRSSFADGGAPMQLHPTFGASPDWQAVREAQGCAPFAEQGPVVEAVRAGILARAGIATIQDPGLSVVRRPDGTVALSSRSAIPGHVTPDPRDRRRLGVKVAAMQRADGHPIPLDHPDLRHGWHDPEADGRWTDGSAIIPASLAGAGLPTMTLAATLDYPLTVAPGRYAAAAWG